MLPLNSNRKPNMGSPMAPSHLTLNYLGRLKSKSPRFCRLICLKGAKCGIITFDGFSQGHSDFKILYLEREPVKPCVTINMNTKPYMRSSGSVIVGSILIWMPQKGICGRVGFSTVSGLSYSVQNTRHTNNGKGQQRRTIFCYSFP